MTKNLLVFFEERSLGPIQVVNLVSVRIEKVIIKSTPLSHIVLRCILLLLLICKVFLPDNILRFLVDGRVVLCQ